MAEGNGAPMGGNGIYKTLFVGTLSLSVVLGGGAWGIWNTSNQDRIERLEAVNAKQWDRLADLTQSVITNNGRISRNERDLQDQEQRLRELERRITHH